MLSRRQRPLLRESGIGASFAKGIEHLGIERFSRRAAEVSYEALNNWIDLAVSLLTGGRF